MDMDGTIIETKSGETFPTNPDDWKFKPHILNAIRYFMDKDWMLVIITNQAGANLGFIRPKEIHDKVNEIIDNIRLYVGHGKYMYRILFSENRKPNPIEGQLIIEKFPDVQYLMVGDASGLTRKITKDGKEELVEDFSDSDKVFAENLGIPYLDYQEFLKVYAKWK